MSKLTWYELTFPREVPSECYRQTFRGFWRPVGARHSFWRRSERRMLCAIVSVLARLAREPSLLNFDRSSRALISCRSLVRVYLSPGQLLLGSRHGGASFDSTHPTRSHEVCYRRCPTSAPANR